MTITGTVKAEFSIDYEYDGAFSLQYINNKARHVVPVGEEKCVQHTPDGDTAAFGGDHQSFFCSTKAVRQRVRQIQNEDIFTRPIQPSTWRWW